jgi:hypothetical protein
MVFSIIFNKPFYVFVNKSRGASRFISLASQFGFEDRLIEGVGYKIPRLDIDNGPGVNKIQSLKEQSLNILAMSLK